MTEDRKESEPKKATVELPVDEAYDLMRIKVLDGLQRDMVRWVKWKFWVISFVAVISSYFGITFVAKETIRSALEKEIGDANRAAIHAKIATEDSRAQTAGYIKIVEGLQATAKDTETQYRSLGQKFEADTRKIKADAAREVNDVGERMARLEKLVGQLAKDNQSALAAYRKEIAQLKASTSEENAKIAENSRHEITVYFNQKTVDLYDAVVQKLVDVGYRASSVSIDSTVISARDIPGNLLLYDGQSEKKVKEVVELLRPLVKFKEVREPRIGQLLPLAAIQGPAGRPRSLMAIYLVEKQ